MAGLEKDLVGACPGTWMASGCCMASICGGTAVSRSVDESTAVLDGLERPVLSEPDGQVSEMEELKLESMI